jgi:hypothetical protein
VNGARRYLKEGERITAAEPPDASGTRVIPLSSAP